MRISLRWLAALCLLTCACGCGDSPRVVVRDVMSVRNELVDALLKVTDESSAKSVYNDEIKKLQKKWDDGVRKRLEEWQVKINSQEKSIKRSTPNLKAGQVSDAVRSANPEFAETDDVAEDIREEVKATSKRLNRQLKRIGEIFDKSRMGSKDELKGLKDVLKTPPIFGTRIPGGTDVDWGPPLRVFTADYKPEPLYKHKGAADDDR